MKTIVVKVLPILILTIQFISCQKKPVVVPPVKEEVCQITQMSWDLSFPNTTNSAKFTYNSAGNPVSVVVTGVATGNPHVLFLYDKYNRVTDYIGTYNDNTDPAKMPALFLYEYWVRYAYANNDPLSMPVSDTLRLVGAYNNGKFDRTSLLIIEKLVYDSQQRIVQVNTVQENTTKTYNYSYDTNGNLILPNVTYDNKINYKQTNKIWMLMERNFSKNNPFSATTYNSAGYPTVFPKPAPTAVSLDWFLRRAMNILTMDYSCSVPAAQ